MIGNDEIYTLLNVSAITSLLTSYGGISGIFADNIIPNEFNSVSVKATDTTLNYYPAGAFSGALDYGDYAFNINCRAKTFYESRTLAETVHSNINRYSASYNIVSTLLDTISPIDETDNYLTPIQITLKTR